MLSCCVAPSMAATRWPRTATATYVIQIWTRIRDGSTSSGRSTRWRAPASRGRAIGGRRGVSRRPGRRPLAAEHGLRLVGWDADTRDWRGDDAGSMLAAVASRLDQTGSIVLAHDGLGPGARRSGCAETVALIAPLVAAGRALGLEPRELA